MKHYLQVTPGFFGLMATLLSQTQTSSRIMALAIVAARCLTCMLLLSHFLSNLGRRRHRNTCADCCFAVMQIKLSSFSRASLHFCICIVFKRTENMICVKCIITSLGPENLKLCLQHACHLSLRWWINVGSVKLDEKIQRTRERKRDRICSRQHSQSSSLLFLQILNIQRVFDCVLARISLFLLSFFI